MLENFELIISTDNVVYPRGENYCWGLHRIQLICNGSYYRATLNKLRIVKVYGAIIKVEYVRNTQNG